MKLAPALVVLSFCLLGSCSAVHPDDTSVATSQLVGPGPQTPVIMTYDAQGRLRTAEYALAGRRLRYDYDGNGNRTTQAIDSVITTPAPVLP